MTTIIAVVIVIRVRVLLSVPTLSRGVPRAAEAAPTIIVLVRRGLSRGYIVGRR